jgi:transmembrane sensor
MTGLFASLKPNAQILDEASAWFVEFSESEIEPAAREAFSLWLRASPEHVRAYLKVSATFDTMGQLHRHRGRDVQALLDALLAEGNVVDLGSKKAPTTGKTSLPLLGQESGLRSGSARSRLIAASVAILVFAVGALAIWNAQRWVYATGIGEQRLVNLADGSTIELNAQSRLRVQLTQSERLVDLEGGQALFHVAKDPSRPFIVKSDGTRVRAVGTQFDVNREATDTVVTVLEGRVAVATNQDGVADARAPTLYLSAGDQVTLAQTSTPATPNTHPTPTRADVAAVTAWTQHKLVFASSPLPEVAGEYNRYHEKRLRVADPALADFRISGVFSAVDASALIAFLRAQPNIQVEENDREIVLKSR